jgi:hypothetical protein
MPDYGLGRRFAPDARDEAFRMRAVLDPLREQFFPKGLPPGTRHYRPGPVLDQGRTGTCVGHGWRGWLDGAPLMTRGGMAPFDLYREFVQVDEWPDNDNEANAPDAGLQSGTSVRAGAKVLQAQGHIAEYRWAEGAEDVRAWHLAGLGTVVLGIIWTDQMFDPDRDGFIHYRGRVEGGHCIKSTGWSDARGRGALRIQNSWDRSWGQGGRAWIAYEDLDRLIKDDGEACAATEQKLAPTTGTT